MMDDKKGGFSEGNPNETVKVDKETVKEVQPEQNEKK